MSTSQAVCAELHLTGGFAVAIASPFSMPRNCDQWPGVGAWGVVCESAVELKHKIKLKATKPNSAFRNELVLTIRDVSEESFIGSKLVEAFQCDCLENLVTANYPQMRGDGLSHSKAVSIYLIRAHSSLAFAATSAAGCPSVELLRRCCHPNRQARVGCVPIELPPTTAAETLESARGLR